MKNVQLKVTEKGREQKEQHEKNVKRGRNSRNKGANYERSIAKLLEKVFGEAFVRTPLSGGFAKNKMAKGDDFRGDIVPVDSNIDCKLHIECKNTKTWSLPQWFKQAESDCPKDKVPCVIFHKFNTSKSYIALDLEDFLKLVPKDNIIKVVEE
jgi:hypothetical protein|nr:MAG TPA: HOLLIDAY JUNCTION RESOLVASE HOMOLOGOUS RECOMBINATION [Caudoviricetes sp.]